MTELAFWTELAKANWSIVAGAVFAASFAYIGYRRILAKYPMPGDPGYPGDAPQRVAPERR